MQNRPLISITAVIENLLRRKWAVAILQHLGNGSDLATIYKREPALTSAVMNAILRKMLRYDLITRHPKLTPTRVIEYRLTDRGKKILRILALIEHLDELRADDNISLEQFAPKELPFPSGANIAPPKKQRS